MTKKFALGCPCAHCGQQNAQVRASYMDGDFLVRVRHCNSCGENFDTHEIPSTSLIRLMAQASRVVRIPHAGETDDEMGTR